MTILHFKVVLAIFIKINIKNRKIRLYSQFYSLITSKCVPDYTDSVSYSAVIRLVLVGSIVYKLANLNP